MSMSRQGHDREPPSSARELSLEPASPTTRHRSSTSRLARRRSTISLAPSRRGHDDWSSDDDTYAYSEGSHDSQSSWDSDTGEDAAYGLTYPGRKDWSSASDDSDDSDSRKRDESNFRHRRRRRRDRSTAASSWPWIGPDRSNDAMLAGVSCLAVALFASAIIRS
jgi:hypothetical protein